MDILGEIGVRLRAIADTFKDEAEKEVKAAAPKAVEIPLNVADLTGAQKAALAAAGGAREQLAATRKELTGIEKKIQDLTAARKAAEAAGGPILEAFRRQQAEFAKKPDPNQDEAPLRKRADTLRLQLLLEAELAAAAQKRAREVLRADAATAASAPGRRGGVGIREITAGRTGGLAGLASAGARLGLVGLAASAAFQAVGELQQSLRVTGDEAFTTEGRLRNLGAELLGGNLIGGIKALAATRKAEFAGGLGDALTAQIEKQRAASDPLIVTEQKLDLVRQKGRDSLVAYVRIMEMAGHISEKQADALIEVSDQMERNKKIVEASTTAYANYQAAVEKAGGSLEKAFGPERGGPGGVAAGRPKGGTSPVFVAGSGGTDVAAQIRASINSRIQDEQEIAGARMREARISRKIAQDSFNVAKSNVAAGNAAIHSAADEYLKLVQANTTLAQAAQTVETTAKAAAEHGQALGDAVRDAWVSAIPDPGAQATAGLRAQRIKEKNARDAFDAAKKGTKDANDAYAAWQIEKAKSAGLESSIAQSARETAKSAREASLANDITAAQLAGDVPKLKRAYRASIAYWTAIRDNTKLAADVREAAEGNVLSLTEQLKGIGSQLKDAKLQNDLAEAELKGADTRPFLNAIKSWAFQQMNAAKVGTEAYETLRGIYLSAAQAVKGNNSTLNALKLANREARALLTETTRDEEKLYREQVAFWKRRAAATKGEGIVHQNAIKEQLAWEQKLKGLSEEIKPTTTVFDLLTKSTEAFAKHAGNLINSRNRFGTGDAFTSGIRGEIGSTPNAAGRARLGLDDDAIRTSLERNTAATDRLTAAFNRNDDVHGGGNRATPSRADVVGMRYQAMAARYAEVAREARAGIS